MVECIEQLAMEFEPQPLAERYLLLETELPVIQTWAAADGAGRISDGPRHDRGIGKGVRVESKVARSTRIEALERLTAVGLARRFEIEAALQFDVILRRNADRESSLERGNARNAPAVQGFPLKTVILWHRQFPVVAEHEAVPGIEERQGPVAFGVDRIHQTFESRSVIERLTQRIRRLELQTVREPLLDAHLKPVVGRVGDGILSENAGEDRDGVWRT